MKKDGKEYGKIDFLNALQTDGEQALKPLYMKIKPEYLHFMAKYTKDLDVRLDSFHEAFIAFYEYCVRGKYDPQKSSPKTMIFMMGRSYLINRLKKEKRKREITQQMVDPEIQEHMDDHFNLELDEDIVKIRVALSSLGEKCRELLRLFYYHNYSIGAILQEMDYKNENVVSSHKSRCLKQLREILRAKDDEG